MLYDEEFVCKKICDFRPLKPVLCQGARVFNTFALNSPRNKREILEIKVDDETPTVLKIRFYSQKLLKENREGNSLQKYSEILVNEFGFQRYLSNSGKLFRSKIS